MSNDGSTLFVTIALNRPLSMFWSLFDDFFLQHYAARLYFNVAKKIEAAFGDQLEKPCGLRAMPKTFRSVVAHSPRRVLVARAL